MWCYQSQDSPILSNTTIRCCAINSDVQFKHAMYSNQLKYQLLAKSTPYLYVMVTTKLILQGYFFFALAVTMIATHQAWGETDCYEEKESVKHKCSRSISTTLPMTTIIFIFIQVVNVVVL
jgi:hypothetical protein